MVKASLVETVSLSEEDEADGVVSQRHLEDEGGREEGGRD